jgi:TRAP-type C4-dicarboxylate transport system permease small subunit
VSKDHTLDLQRRPGRQVEEAIAAAFLTILTIVILVQIGSREVLGRSVIGAEDVAALAMSWLVFMGAAAAARRDGHLSVAFLTGLLSEAWRRRVGVGVALLVVSLLAVLTVEGVRLALLQRNTYSPSLEWPMVLNSAAFPLSTVLMGIYFARHALRLWRATDGGGHR